MNKYCTKYPVILVHGIIAKDFSFYRAFRKIKDKLALNHVHVYIGNHDGIGSIENNAKQLKAQIIEILKTEKVDKINIIAHSKGGLDSRYMISKLDMAKHVASLTTLSTPHHGSKLASNLLKLPKFVIKFLCFWSNFFFKICKDKNPDLLAVGKDLSYESMIEFNREIVNNKDVFYQSYSSSLKNKRQFIMFVPYYLTKFIESEDTDGLVSVSSSVWGNYKGNTDGNFDHIEIIAFFGQKKRIEKVSEFYLKLVEELKQLGF
ncbi:MAG: hypothetical protein MSA65_01650 [Mollicutes bacterium]|nr:hypothetical protein [Mollicutes bacterium]